MDWGNEGRCTPVGVLVCTGFFAFLSIVCFWYFGQRGYTLILAMHWLCTGYALAMHWLCTGYALAMHMALLGNVDMDCLIRLSQNGKTHLGLNHPRYPPIPCF